MYITVETYYQGIIPNDCTSGDYYQFGYKYEYPNPMVHFTVYKLEGRLYQMVEEHLYSDQGHNAILISGKDQKPG